MDKGPKYEARYYKTPKGKHRQKLFDVNCSNVFFDPPSSVMKLKTKIN